MRILVLSDLHANATALTAALAAAKDRWDHAVCLGDVVGYGPDPNEVTSKIRELGVRTIRGNHDKAATDLMATHDFNPVAKAAVDWTRSQLTPDNLKWLSELPPGPLETEGIVLVHGAFQDEDEYVFTPAQALEGLLDLALDVEALEDRDAVLVEHNFRGGALRDLADEFLGATVVLGAVDQHAVDFLREKIAHGALDDVGLLVKAGG